MGRVGVAELKATLSTHLARVKAGETVTVTDHGRPIARLVPIGSGEKGEERLEEMERLGLLRRGAGPLPASFWDLPRQVDPSGQSLAFLLSDRNEGG